MMKYRKFVNRVSIMAVEGRLKGDRFSPWFNAETA